jgi:hypothetical protein
MNDEKLIWVSYEKSILSEAKIEIMYYDEDNDEYDPWEIAQKLRLIHLIRVEPLVIY